MAGINVGLTIEPLAQPTQLQLLLCKTAKAVLLQTDLLACGN